VPSHSVSNMKLDVFAPLAALVSLAAAHGAVTSYIIGGTSYPGYEGFAPSTSPKTIQWQCMHPCSFLYFLSLSLSL